jgi:hypothetical protein
MLTAFNAELRLQRELAQSELESAQSSGDTFLVEAMRARIGELDELAAHHGEDALT